ncbi:cat eye syndrome critical region protein 5 [Echinococcus multilocularis]|uniref:Cat eye syndrome critical region protein 5 n=1 Tax=Echinococcus multilocularis TaxID=6211 RepID=A0A087VZ70_ECHMU|nr:cat eye syndrome critical region protein 5 [Echinococcus multilocularis]
MYSVTAQADIHAFSWFFKQVVRRHFFTKKKVPQDVSFRSADFGIAFDVDGVFTRGPLVLPGAVRASEMLHEKNGNWRVPVLFLTNAANVSKETKAAELSSILNRKILPSEIVMPHSALRLYSVFDKHVAVCGHGPLKAIAQSIGFKKFSTVEDISAAFPWLDACRPKEVLYSGNIRKAEFSKIEAIVLLGEPQRWEQSLQIILDLLIQNGDLNKTSEVILPKSSSPQLPIFACGSDLLWASNAPNPRIAMGSFMCCLDTLYEKLTGRHLTYTSLLGKPNPLVYTFALSQLNAIAAKRFGATRLLKRIYCIGDNPEVDIYGANLFNLYLQTISEETWSSLFLLVNTLVQEEHPCLFPNPSTTICERPEILSEKEQDKWSSLIRRSKDMFEVLRELVMRKPKRPSPCTMEPVLVTSGVYQEHEGVPGEWKGLHHVLHDFPDLSHLYEPRFVAPNVAEAVASILSLESALGSSQPTSIPASANGDLN